MLTHSRLAIFTLLVSSFIWGLIWYPYRALTSFGLTGELSSFLSYAIALCLGLGGMAYKRERLPLDVGLIGVAISAACANLGYVLGVIHGEVVRVTLLFFLAPIWTLVLSRILLKEPLNQHSLTAIALSTTGATIMLWNPSIGWPVPQTIADWLGLFAGIGFAVSNVLSRKLTHLSIEHKSMAIWLGVSLIAGGYSILAHDLPHILGTLNLQAWGIVLLLGVVIFAVNIVVQYGLHRLPANVAATILLSELLFAASSAYLLEGETLRLTTGIGGGLIVIASVLTCKQIEEA